jgi:hypothetical protein
MSWLTDGLIDWRLTDWRAFTLNLFSPPLTAPVWPGSTVLESKVPIRLRGASCLPDFSGGGGLEGKNRLMLWLGRFVYCRCCHLRLSCALGWLRGARSGRAVCQGGRLRKPWWACPANSAHLLVVQGGQSGDWLRSWDPKRPSLGPYTNKRRIPLLLVFTFIFDTWIKLFILILNFIIY